MWDDINTNIIAMCALAGVLIVVLLGLAMRHDNQERAAFFESCERDHKHYECQVMWGHAGNVTVPPIVVPVYR